MEEGLWLEAGKLRLVAGKLSLLRRLRCGPLAKAGRQQVLVAGLQLPNLHWLRCGPLAKARWQQALAAGLQISNLQKLRCGPPAKARRQGVRAGQCPLEPLRHGPLAKARGQHGLLVGQLALLRRLGCGRLANGLRRLCCWFAACWGQRLNLFRRAGKQPRNGLLKGIALKA